MAELERELLILGRRLELPPQPELARAVRARLAERPAPVFPWRRTLVVAFAVLAVAIAAVFAVPSARTAILRWLGLANVRVVRVTRLPETRRLAASDLGTKTTLAAAQRRLGFALQQPRERPDSVYLQTTIGPPRVTLVYGSAKKPRLLLTEFRGTGTTNFVQKLVGPGTTVERVRVEGNPGLWIAGQPHAVYYTLGSTRMVYIDEPLLAANTLVWERPGGITLRLEGRLSKGDAIRLAGSLR